MSDEAYAIYEEALKQQHTRNEARRIRSRVNEARMSPHAAGARWPFELLQNALDAGPRPRRSSVSVRLRRTSATVLFEHDGAPFTFTELAALLSGGSSKEFESETTTGRFGTGFLVTHVLAERARLRGLLDVGDGYEQFDLILDRGGDEQEILKNISDCDESIRAATPVAPVENTPSAVFTYEVGDNSALSLGVDAFKDALPYLYATRPNLGRVEFALDEETNEVWSAGEVHESALESGTVMYREIHVERNGIGQPELRIYRFATATASAAIVLLESGENGWTIVAPKAGTPRIYREYPLRGSAFLPVNFVLDGKFDPDQERNRLLMNDGDKCLISSALDACALAAQHALQSQWRNPHRLARAARPAVGFDASNQDELRWWAEQLATLAQRLAELPIVNCTSGFLPAFSAEGTYADFVLPRLSDADTTDETTVARVLPLFEAATPLYPPRQELADKWTAIAQEWRELGVEVNTVALSRLADYVRDNAGVTWRVAGRRGSPALGRAVSRCCW